MLWLAALAFAVPDRVAQSWTVASPVYGAVADSGDTVAILGTSFTLLDLGTWESTALTSICADGGSPGGLAAGTWTTTDDDSVTTTTDSYWIGCGDGSVERIDIIDGSPTLSDEVLSAGSTAVTALEWDGTSLFVLMQGDSGLADLTALSPTDASVVTSYPTTLSHDDVNDTLLLNGSLYVLHGGDDISRVTTSGAAVILTSEATGADYQTATASDAGLIFLTDTTGGDLWSFDTGDNGYTLYLADVGEDTTALCLDETAGWAAIAADADLVFVAFTSGTFGDEEGRVSDLGALQWAAAVEDGVLGFATDESLLSWVTEGAWVEITSAPSSAATGDVEISFSSDLDGDWTLWLGDDLDTATELDNGSATADETVTVTTTIDDAWIEGVNRLWVTLDDGVGIGHDATDITVDAPPPQMAISVGFGESTFLVEIAGDDTEDLDHFVIYLSDAAFTAAEYETGGPTFESDDVNTPLEIDATPGEDASYTFYPLENGTTYWAAVRAVDTGGLEGPMSSVLSATPSYTYSASERRGDPGGFGCSTAPGSSGIAGILAVCALVARRRHDVARVDGAPTAPSRPHLPSPR